MIPNPPGNDPHLQVKGAPPSEPLFGAMGPDHAGFFPLWDFEHLVFEEDEDGLTTPLRNASVVFEEIGHVLQLVMPAEGINLDDPVDGSFSKMIETLALKYYASALLLDDLIALMGQRYLETGDVNYDSLSTEVKRMKTGLLLVGWGMYTQNLTNPNHFTKLQNALVNLGDLLASFEAYPQGSQAKANLDSMAEGVGVAKEMVIIGLDQVLEQDYFLWGMQNRLNPMFLDLAAALRPHRRVKIDLDPRAWFGSTIEGVMVRVQDANTLEILESLVVKSSDLYEIDIPEYPGRDLKIWIKAPTHLSVVVGMLAGETYAEAASCLGGDIDGDNDVDETDYLAVLDDQGQGGLLATVFPSTDCNSDGAVDALDPSVVSSNLGLIGATLP